jgi:hypothetical protein
MENKEVKSELNSAFFEEDFQAINEEILKEEKQFKTNYDSIMFLLIKKELNKLNELFLNSSEKLKEKMKECLLYESLTKLYFLEGNSKITFFLIHKNKIKSLDLKNQNPILFWKSLLQFYENKNKK